MKGRSVIRKTTETLLEEGPGAVMLKAGRRTKFVVDLAVAIGKLRRAAVRTTGVDESLDLAFGFSVGQVAIAPAQVRDEIEALLRLLEGDPPRTVLEIGTARGGTLFLLSRVASAQARLASIDLPGGEFGGGYRRLWAPLLRTFRREGQTFNLIRADSHRAATLAEARQWLAGDPLDFLLIDGDHSLEGVRRDLLAYGPLVRPGGLIAIHDIVPGPVDMVGGVPGFWQLVRQVFETRELVADWAQGGCGIGIVFVPPQGIAPDSLDRHGEPRRASGGGAG